MTSGNSSVHSLCEIRTPLFATSMPKWAYDTDWSLFPSQDMHFNMHFLGRLKFFMILCSSFSCFCFLRIKFKYLVQHWKMYLYFSSRLEIFQFLYTINFARFIQFVATFIANINRLLLISINHVLIGNIFPVVVMTTFKFSETKM